MNYGSRKIELFLRILRISRTSCELIHTGLQTINRLTLDFKLCYIILEFEIAKSWNHKQGPQIPFNLEVWKFSGSLAQDVWSSVFKIKSCRLARADRLVRDCPGSLRGLKFLSIWSQNFRNCLVLILALIHGIHQWIGWLSKNSKFSFLSLNCHFWEKIAKRILPDFYEFTLYAIP